MSRLPPTANAAAARCGIPDEDGGEDMVNRRLVLKALGLSAGLAAAGSAFEIDALAHAAETQAAAASAAPFTLPPLPYAYDALEPYIDATTMHLHHDKHHQSYVINLNTTVAAHPELADKTLEQLVSNLNDLPDAARTAVRNNGGGHFNHSFMWPTLGSGGSVPAGELAKAIKANFGSLPVLQDKLKSAAMGVFGSGWAWLVTLPDGTLAIETTPNQDTPMTSGHKPVLGVDVWEHAYYLKYQNKRAEYLQAFFQVVNWDFISEKFAQKA